MTKKVRQILGWQGVTLRVFDDWSIVGFGGDNATGSLRIDSGGGDDSETISGLEIRWSQAKGQQSVESLESRIKPLLKTVEAEAKKVGLVSRPIVKPFKDAAHPERDVTIGYKWSANRAGRGRIFHCSECGRIVIAQAYGSPSEEFYRLAKPLLDSIACHPEADGQVRWGLYGLLVDVPADFQLVYQQLMNVYIQLKFQRKNSVEHLMVEQWSLANVQLKGAYLDEWYDLKSVGWTDGVRAEKAESLVRGHPSLFVEGKRSEPISMIIDTAKQYSRFRKPALNYAAMVWECPQTNRAYMVQSFTRAAEPELVKHCAERTVCHDPADSAENGED